MTPETVWVAVSALASVALLAVTGAYVWISGRLLKAAQEQIWETSRPRLLIALRTNQGGQYLVLHIENVGAEPARNLQLSLDRPVHRTSGNKESLADAPLFSNGLSSFPPNTPSRFGIGTYWQYLGADDHLKHPLTFTVSATYEACGRYLTETFPIQVEEQYRLTTIEVDEIEKFSKSFPRTFEAGIRDLCEAIEQLSKKTSRPLT